MNRDGFRLESNRPLPELKEESKDNQMKIKKLASKLNIYAHSAELICGECCYFCVTNYVSFADHSCDPNALVMVMPSEQHGGGVLLYCLKSIKKDEEIKISYLPLDHIVAESSLFTHASLTSILGGNECKCGSIYCHHRLPRPSSSQFLPPNVQQLADRAVFLASKNNFKNASSIQQMFACYFITSRTQNIDTLDLQTRRIFALMSRSK